MAERKSWRRRLFGPSKAERAAAQLARMAEQLAAVEQLAEAVRTAATRQRGFQAQTDALRVAAQRAALAEETRVQPDLTAEQVRLELADLQAMMERAIVVDPEGEKRARKLLRDHCTPAQWEQFRTTNKIDVQGSHHQYRIGPSGARILSGSYMGGDLCVAPRLRYQPLPMADKALTMKLWIEANEEKFLAIANPTWAPYAHLTLDDRLVARPGREEHHAQWGQPYPPQVGFLTNTAFTNTATTVTNTTINTTINPNDIVFTYTYEMPPEGRETRDRLVR